MSKRNTEMFNLSFLDLLSGALGAVIFMFIITPKGGKAPAPHPQVVVAIDSFHNQIFGTLHDSLATKSIGDTLLVLIKDFQKMPTIEDCPECPAPVECPDCPRCPEQRQIAERKYNGGQTVKVSTEKPGKAENVSPTASVKVKTASTDTEKVDTPKEQKNQYKGDPPSVPCLVSFEIRWEEIEDNVDFFVCRDNNCVYGGRRKNKNIGFWDSGKSKTSIFGSDLRTTMEAVRQFDNIIPGEYLLYAQFKESEKGNTSTKISGLIYTNARGEKEMGERFIRTIKLDKKKRTLLGKVKLEANGSFKFNKN